MHRAAGYGNGFTLIEVLVAISLMAVLSLMCWRGLDSVIRGRDRILATGDQMQSLSTSMAQMDEDLRRSQPMRGILLRDPVSTTRTEQGIVLTLDRPVPGVATGMIQHVEWRVQGGRLERGYAAPENPVAPVSARTMAWQTLLEPVDGWSIRLLRKNLRKQWMDALTEVNAAANMGDIAGIEISMVSGAQTITRIFVVED